MRQRGFTLIEVLVVLAIGSVLMTSALLTLQQVVWGTLRAGSQTMALTDVNFAAASIKEDIEMAQSTNLIDGNPVPQSSVTLTWIDYTLFTSATQTHHSSMYTLSGTKLLRTYDGTVSIVSRHITSIGFTQNGRVVTVSVTATGTDVPQRSKTFNFSMRMRADGVR